MRQDSLFVCIGLIAGVWGCERDSDNNRRDGEVSDTGDSFQDAVDGADMDHDVVVNPEPDFLWPPSQFALELADWGLSFSGLVVDGPRVAFHIEAERDGFCRKLTYEPVNCTPTCGVDAVCVGGECKTHPLPISIGDVELSGFSNGTIVVSEGPVGQYFYQTETVFAADAPQNIGLSPVESGPLAFDLTVSKVTAVVPAADWSQIISARGQGDATLRWNNPDPTARIYIRMTTGIGTHGGISPVEIECEGPDVGELRLPGSFLDALYAEGWSCGECGGNDLWRYRAATTESSNPIQFRVQARSTFFHHPKFDF